MKLIHKHIALVLEPLQSGSLSLNWRLVLLTLILVSVGIIMVASASIEYAMYQYDDPWYFLKKHLIYLAMGLAAGFVVFMIPTSFWREYGWMLFFVALFLLTIVLIPGVGREVNGARRWLQIGPLTFQVSELVKFLSVIFFSSYLANSQYFLQTQWKELFKPLLMLVTLMFLLLLEPDFGGAVVLAVAVGGMLFLAGAKLWQCILLLVSGLGILASLVWFVDYRRDRILSYLDPWSDPFNGGYQLVQSLIAFGRGEWFGVGLGNSIQKLLYLSESHTDFIFAIFAEEQGFVGVLLLLSVFLLLVSQIFFIANKAIKRNSTFLALSVFGIGLLLSFQILVNVGVASGFFPTKGLTLPFISYGGSSLIVNCLLIGLLLRIDCDLDLDIIRQQREAM